MAKCLKATQKRMCVHAAGYTTYVRNVTVFVQRTFDLNYWPAAVLLSAAVNGEPRDKSGT
jgi:hypothetical protein